MLAYLSLLSITGFAALLKRSNPMRVILFVAVTTYFVAFRLEVGFDWVVYKDQFDTLSDIRTFEFFNRFWELVVLFTHEPLFLLTSFAFTRVFPDYEYFQAAILLFFVYSTARLGKSFGVQNVIAAMIPIHLFLLFSLEFSTTRQLLALAVFNFGLALYLEGRLRWAIVAFALAPFFHSSAALYLITALMAFGSTKISQIIVAISWIVVLGITVVGLDTLLVDRLPGFLGAKLDYYLVERGYNYSLYEQVFFLGFFGGVVVVARRLRRSTEERNVRRIADFLVLLCFVALAGFLVNTIRNRLMYEIVILASLVCFLPAFRLRRYFQIFVFSFGAVFFTLSVTTTTSFMYVPYQNYLWFQITGQESDGHERMARLWQIVRETRN